MNRTEKKELVAELNEKFNNSASVVVTHYRGLTVAQVSELRKNLRELGASYKVAKNRLAKLALQGTQYDQMSELLSGPVGIAFSNDPVAAAKGVVEFAKDNDNLIILGGAIADQQMDEAGIKTLAKLPSLDELRGKIVGMLNTPATRIAGVVQAPAGQLARVVNAHAQNGQ